MGSLSPRGLRGSISREWTQISTRQGPLVKNNYSEQLFRLHSVPNTQKNNTRLYFTRQLSSLPKTPKIICLERRPQSFLVLVERAQKTIGQWLGEYHCELSILLKLKDLLSAASALKYKFGAFLITEKMIKVTSNDNLLVWYNQKYESNLIRLPLPQGVESEQLMILNIVQIFRKCANKAFNINQLFTGPKSFSQFKDKVKHGIQQIESQSIHKTNSLASLYKQTKQDSKSAQKQIKSNSHKVIKYSPYQNRISFSQKRKEQSWNGRIKQLEYLQFNKQQQRNYIKRPFSRKLIKLSPFEQKSSGDCSSSQQLKRQSQNYTDRNQTNLQQIYSTGVHCQKPRFNQISMKKQVRFQQFDLFQRVKSQDKKTNKQNTFSQIKPYFNGVYTQYKCQQSFSNRKRFSLKSTSGSLKKTRQFQDQFREMMLEQCQAIRQQSDQTYKNSASYNHSVQESIREQVKEQMELSLGVSQDFQNLFSDNESTSQKVDDLTREKEFQTLLFDSL